MTRSDRESKGYGEGRPPIKRYDLLNALMARTSDELAWQSKGLCGQEGALDEYDKNPFDAASYLIEDQPEAVEELHHKFCAQCPVIEKCDQWASADKHYAGLAAGKIWGRRGVRGVSVLSITSKKRAERKNNG